MNKTFIIITLTILLFVGCQPKSEAYWQLVNADSLLYNNCVDSAIAVLEDVEPLIKRDSAYYFVLDAETRYRQWKCPDIDELNYSINYYEKHHDNRKLANAYYYKACTFIVRDTLPKECFILLKQAEQSAEKTSDNSLKNKIYSALSYANGAKNQTEEALKYGKKEYYYAQKVNCRRDIAYALLRLSTCYCILGQRDSSEYYIMQCKMLVDEVNDSDKPFIYNLLGENCMTENLDAAIEYFNKALRFKKLPQTYQNLARIYHAKNDTLNWQKYCDSALSNAWYDTKIDILTDIAHINYADRNIAAYKNTTDKTIGILKDFVKYEKNNYSLEIQRKFDFEKQKIEYTRNIFICITIITTLIALCIILYQRRRHDKQKALQKELETENHNLQLYNKLCESQNIIDEYEQNLRYLNDLLDQADSEEYQVSKKQIAEVVEKGKAIFQKIEQNGCIAADKEYWVFCIFYFQNTFSKKAIKVFKNYQELTTEEKIFVIIDDFLTKTDSEIASILDISQTTVRTRRSKMKGKMS
jgi:DNA-directed RNA polymerase specialized sigma24 family protein